MLVFFLSFGRPYFTGDNYNRIEKLANFITLIQKVLNVFRCLYFKSLNVNAALLEKSKRIEKCSRFQNDDYAVLTNMGIKKVVFEIYCDFFFFCKTTKTFT